jgi:hypothetical protein
MMIVWYTAYHIIDDDSMVDIVSNDEWECTKCLCYA